MSHVDFKTVSFDAGWTTLSLNSTWVTYGYDYGVPRYCRINGVVYVQGLIKNGPVSSAIATLPVGFRPDTFVIKSNSMSGGFTRVDFRSDGQIVVSPGSSGWTSIVANFWADQ